jgi:hypothetical protein
MPAGDGLADGAVDEGALEASGTSEVTGVALAAP